MKKGANKKIIWWLDEVFIMRGDYLVMLYQTMLTHYPTTHWTNHVSVSLLCATKQSNNCRPSCSDTREKDGDGRIYTVLSNSGKSSTSVGHIFLIISNNELWYWGGGSGGMLMLTKLLIKLFVAFVITSHNIKFNQLYTIDALSRHVMLALNDGWTLKVSNTARLLLCVNLALCACTVFTQLAFSFNEVRSKLTASVCSALAFAWLVLWLVLWFALCFYSSIQVL